MLGFALALCVLAGVPQLAAQNSKFAPGSPDAQGAVVFVHRASESKPLASVAAQGWGLEPHEVWYAPGLGGIEALAMGDLDADGRWDVVVASPNQSEGHLARFRQHVDGTLQPPLILSYEQPFTNHPSIAILDLDGQYGPDVVIGGSLGLSVFRSNADGGLVASPVLLSRSADALARVDLDLDGLDDLASVSYAQGASVHRNQGDASFVTTPWSIAGTGYRDMTKADFNNDGRVDLAVLAPAQTPPVKVYLNEPGGLRLARTLGGACPDSAHVPRAIAAGDLNLDGRADLVVASGGNSPTSCLLVYVGLQGGQFSPAVALPSYDLPGTLRVNDIDDDGRNDIVVLHGGWNQIGVYLQQSDRTLAPERLFHVSTPSHYYAHALEVGDITGDGCPDVAIAGGTLTTLRGVGCRLVFQSGFESP